MYAIRPDFSNVRRRDPALAGLSWNLSRWCIRNFKGVIRGSNVISLPQRQHRREQKQGRSPNQHKSDGCHLVNTVIHQAQDEKSGDLIGGWRKRVSGGMEQ
jgi:hypothetical protein